MFISLKNKLQKTQDSCIRYCLGLKDRRHLGKNEFEKINWLTVPAYNFKNDLSPKMYG